MKTVECPDWVPDAVREEANKLLAPEAWPYPYTEDAIVLRMVTAPEMRAVWRRLEVWPLNAYWAGVRRASGLSPDSDRDAALRYFFRIACSEFWPLDSAALGRMATEAEQYRMSVSPIQAFTIKPVHSYSNSDLRVFQQDGPYQDYAQAR